jgi:hypothetical protein
LQVRASAGRTHVILIVVTALLASAALVFLIPPGEAPDEPAHLVYVNHLVTRGTLPSADDAIGNLSYEIYQPPLAYVVMAAAVRAAGFEDVEYPFRPDPKFSFQCGRRAFLTPPPSVRVDAARAALRVARCANLGWLLLASTAILLICRRLTDSPWIALAGAAPFALAPELLFTSAIAGNDAAVIALVAGGTLCLIVLVSGSSSPRAAFMASILAGLALWAKISAVAMAPALALSLLWLVRSRRWREVALLVVPGLVLSAAWVIVQMSRIGSILPMAMAAWRGSPPTRLLTEPRWLASVWVGFWAKLGWFNVLLPLPTYLVFVPPTLAALAGVVVVGRSETRNRAGLLLIVVGAANLALLVLYMVRADWQPQGRYLLPAAAAAAGLATIGLDRLCSSWSDGAKKRLAVASCGLAVLAALAMVVVVVRAY